jgi:hypothetical protein
MLIELMIVIATPRIGIKRFGGLAPFTAGLSLRNNNNE